eukprot:COSAG04_NODE_1326_length_7211_cov_1.774606_4_plen_52_part_00
MPKDLMLSSGDVAVAKNTAHVVREVTSIALAALRHAQMKRVSSEPLISGPS